MLSHTHVGITDYQRAFAFYSAVMEVLGHPLKFAEPENQWAAWKSAHTDRPLFIIGRPYNGGHATPGNGQMIALLAPTRAAVEKCHETALAHGGRSEGRPGLRPQYHPNYYGAYFRDPDGNKLCVCCHAPEPAS